MRFAFIHAEKANFSVVALCRVLQVTRQGYYAWTKRPEGARANADRELREKVRAIYQQSRGTYGSPRILAALRHANIRVSKRRVERAMREEGLIGRAPEALPSHYRARQLPPCCAEPLGETVRSRASKSTLGHRHHVHPHSRRVQLSGRYHRPLLSRRGRLVCRYGHLRRASAPSSHHGETPSKAAQRPAPSLRSRLPVHELCVSKRPRRLWHGCQYEPQRRLLG